MANINKNKTVFVAMSGGVDSSVAALLLKKQGYYVVGVFMRCWSDGANCTAEADASDARKVAEQLEIPFYVFDFKKEYRKKVVEYMIDGYRKGITPNPDVMCNKEIKFGLFLEKAFSMGADFVATGHYVRLRRTTINNKQLTTNKKKNSGQMSNVKCQMFSAKDLNKDQSYFLWTLMQKQLKHCLFPIGYYLKSEVREIARKARLLTAEKKDSQGICFLGKVDVEDFLKKYIKPKKGDVLDESGKKIGEHQGVYFYTIGQRHGLGIAGKKPYYIADKNIKNNAITVAEGENNPLLYKKEIELANINFINLNPKSYILDFKLFTRVRYRQSLAKAKLSPIQNSKLRIKNYKLIFDKPQKFVASGQSAVFYNKNGEMLGGGVII